MKISYTKTFINTLDSILQEEYNEITKREDFLVLLTKIELLMNYNEDELAWFEYHKLREYFGRVTITVPVGSSLHSVGSSKEISEELSEDFSEEINNNKNKIKIEKTVSVPIVVPDLPKNETDCANETFLTPKKKRVWKLDFLLKILENKNIIIRTAYDRHNHKTRRYLYNIMFEMECQESEIGIVKEEISEKYCQLLLKEAKAPKEPHLKIQYDLLKSKRFKIDTDFALMWIDDKFYRERSISSNQKRNYTRMVLALEDKLIFTVEGAKGGRVFTNFNSIKRELRQFCTIDGQKLMSMDLKSSQPYLMAQFMNKKWPKESKTFYDTVTKDDIYLFFLKKWNEVNPSGFYREYSIGKNKMEDVYLNTRDDIKPEYLKMLFKIRGRKPALDDVFKSEFPFVYEKVQEQKEGLASTLQREESDLFIPVCTEFAERGCLSVHDSLYFKPELYPSLLDCLKERFSKKNFKDFTFKQENN